MKCLLFLVKVEADETLVGHIAVPPATTFEYEVREALFGLFPAPQEYARSLQNQTEVRQKGGVLKKGGNQGPLTKTSVVPHRLKQVQFATEHQAWLLSSHGSGEALLPLIEDALRHLHDLLYLGQHELTQLQVVQASFGPGKRKKITFLDRGKALSRILCQAIEKLRPDGAVPGRGSIPGREWHPYLILYGAYVEGEQNKHLMSRLYIGEGTFIRTRRRALQAVAKLLEEMEEEAARNSDE
jgi:hypothetical protein